MKKLIFVILSLLLIASCYDYALEDITIDELFYNKEFVKAFGTPDENHNWGFVDQPVVDFDAVEATRAVDTNKNGWYYGYNVNIPGYPDANGYFHGQKTVDSEGYLTGHITVDNIPNHGQTNEDKNWLTNNVGQPTGDVTAEEAAYVQEWFATHHTPASTPLHWTDFFVQFVGYNYKHVIKAGEMDQMGYEDINGGWEHVNNFNNGTKDIMYVMGAGTEAFSYRASHSNTYQNDRYCIVYLSFQVNGHSYEGWYVGFDYESIKYEGNGSEEHNSVHADGYYCDWVFKITPGTFKGYPLTTRVMCEDLGHSYDWDFNDVVFNVTFIVEGGVDYAYIVLEAAGGTMPIYVGINDEKYEVHKLLGDGSMVPIIHPASCATFKVKLSDMGMTLNSNDNLANARNIPIYVKGQTATYKLNNTAIPQKFACPDSVAWTEECQNICEKYKRFPDWIQNFNVEDIWNLDPVHGNGQSTGVYDEEPDNSGNTSGGTTTGGTVVEEGGTGTTTEEPSDNNTEVVTMWESSSSKNISGYGGRFTPPLSNVKAGKMTVTFLPLPAQTVFSLTTGWSNGLSIPDQTIVKGQTSFTVQLTTSDVEKINSQSGLVIIVNNGGAGVNFTSITIQ